MENYSIINDFESYILENEQLLNVLEEHESLLNDLVFPIIKTLIYLKNLNEEDGELDQDNIEIFEFGFQYLFENLEQLKLYFKQYNNNFELFEKKSIYIKMIFQFEEMKVELHKKDEFDVDLQNDLKRIEEALTFFEDCLTRDTAINEFELDFHLRVYYEVNEKYDEILLMSEAFLEYCATYGI